jgi:hypothetical protein
MATPTLYLSPIALILQQVFTNNGIMAQGGLANIYVAGSGTTPATTYTDSTGTVANQNPIVLNGAGRIASQSGAPIAVWAPSGTVLTLQVVDNQGNQLIYLPFISGINDPAGVSSLQSLLASPASSNTSGVGPVAGADLVANAVKSYDVFSDVRAANEPVLVSGQTLIIITYGAITVGDSLGGLFYWSASSTASDDGATVLKPNSVSGAGRWLRVVLPQTAVAPNQGAFEGILGDGTNSVLAQVFYTVANGRVTLRVAGATFTSAASGLTLTGMPAMLTPLSTQVLPCYLTDNTAAGVLGAAAVQVSGGQIVFSLASTSAISGRAQLSTTAFTTSGNKGLASWSITYELN